MPRHCSGQNVEERIIISFRRTLMALVICLPRPDCRDRQLMAQTDSAVAVTAPAWDAVFTRGNGWTGGDGAGTVALEPGRVVWLFGDSLIGAIADGKHAPGSQMVNNAVATQQWNDPAAPKKDEFQFAWGKAGNGKLTAWLEPDPQAVQSSYQSPGAASPDGWYWPAGGGCLIKTRKTGGGELQERLYLFLFHVGSTGTDGVWSFKSIGGAVAAIDNPGQPVDQWTVRQLDLPHTIDSMQLDPRHENPLYHFESTWGLACLANPPSHQSVETPCVYIFGTRQRENHNRQLLLARVEAERFEDFSQWRFLAAGGRWSDQQGEAVAIAEHVAAELSVERLEFNGRQWYVMIHSDAMLGTRILARVAADIEGPWSEPKVVFDVPDVRKSRNYFTYAAKGHLAISAERQLLITYVVNSSDFWEMLGDASIYRPRCITVPISRLLE